MVELHPHKVLCTPEQTGSIQWVDYAPHMKMGVDHSGLKIGPEHGQVDG